MRINEFTRKCVVFLGVLTPAGAFAPYGTGFLVMWRGEDGLYWWYLVTAKHVLDDMRASKLSLVCRINSLEGSGQLGSVPVDNWATHPTNKRCDIAVTPITVSIDTFDVKASSLVDGALTEEYVKDNDVGCGDQVFTVGLLVRHFGKTKNVPVVRMGNIAAMPEEHIDFGGKLGEQEVYLIESRSIGGLSGSAVFLQTPPWRVVRGAMKSMGGHQREYLMGVNIGLFTANAHGDSVPTDPADRREAFLEGVSAGIAVVVPIDRVIEIISDSPILQETRRESRRMHEEKIGFVATSAASTITPLVAEVDASAARASR
jgi:hypothetical protein